MELETRLEAELEAVVEGQAGKNSAAGQLARIMPTL